MGEDPHTDEVRETLAHLGYSVTPIPTGTKDSADLWAHAGDDRLTVEVKERVDDLDVVGELRNEPGEVVTRDTAVSRKDTLGRIIHKANSQIAASQSQYPGLGVLWFRPSPELGISEAADLMIANLLGVRWLGFRVAGRFGFAPVFLFSRTDFHRYPTLDAAVLDSPGGQRLLLNPYSPRKDLVRSSLLHRHFAPHAAVLDMDSMESNERHFILRSAVDRADEQAALTALGNQHSGYAFMISNLHSFKGFAQVRREDLD